MTAAAKGITMSLTNASVNVEQVKTTLETTTHSIIRLTPRLAPIHAIPTNSKKTSSKLHLQSF